MEIKDLLAKIAEYDEMEAPDGMNIVEDIDQENEDAENKRKLRIYKKAYEALEELCDFFEEECIDPMTGKLDEETEAFNNQLHEVINEIYSRSLAFEG